MGDKSNKTIENASMVSADLSSLKTELQEELHHLLNFWSTEAIDTKHSGFLGQMNHYGEKFPEAPKGTILVINI